MHTMDMKEQRRRAIAELIRGELLASQEEVAERLAARGYAVTQATVSRDLEQIGAAKVRRDGRLAYALPEGIASSPGPRLQRVLADWVRSVEAAGNLVVVKTPPGSAHLVGVALDQADWPEVAGTICGDDTIFVAVGEAAKARLVAARIKSLSVGEAA